MPFSPPTGACGMNCTEAHQHELRRQVCRGVDAKLQISFHCCHKPGRVHMKTSEQTDLIDAAIAKAQQSRTHAALDKTNPHFHSEYASLASIIDATENFANEGIAIEEATEI